MRHVNSDFMSLNQMLYIIGETVENPNIGLLYIDKIEDSFFDDFISTIDRDDLGLLIEARPGSDAFACAEWFVPTAIAVFIGKPYFESFLKEIGKDHYTALKNALSKLCTKTVSSRRFEPLILASSPGKANQNNPYTLSFSIMADTGDGYNFKLMLPKFNDSFNYQEATEKFIDFVAEYHSERELSRAFEIMRLSKIPGGTVLVRYNPESFDIEWQDYLTPEIRARVNVQQENTADS